MASRILVLAAALATAAVAAAKDEAPKGLSKEEARARIETVLSLQQLTWTLLNFADNYKSLLPPADGTKTKEAPELEGLSWRAHLLRYMDVGGNPIRLGELAELAEKGKRPAAEPWNRPDLLKLSVVPFRPPVEGKTKAPGDTFYRVFIGGGAAFEPGKRVSVDDFPDGLGNTILVVEVGEAVPWTKPAELEYSPDKPLPKLGGLFPDGFYAAFADGKIRVISKDTDEKELRAMITRGGKEKITRLPPEVDMKALEKAAGPR
jgi:hypothetical protein